MQDENYVQSQYTDEIKQKISVFAPEELIPKLTKPGYYTEPSMVTLCRFTEDDLANIEEFSIYNDQARIIFKGKTDVRGLDLDKIVVLGHQSVMILLK